MVKFRIGKNLKCQPPSTTIDCCPPCPQSSPCLNYLEETTSFNIGDIIYVTYETECQGSTPISPIIIYKETGTGWTEITRYVPIEAYPTMIWMGTLLSTNGNYKVEYDSYSATFTVGSSSSNTLMYVAGGAIAVGLILYLMKNRQ